MSELNKEVLNKIIKFYKNFVDDLSVLNILQGIKNEEREKKSGFVDFSHSKFVRGFCHFIDIKDEFDKICWDNIRNKMLLAAEKSQDFLKEKKKITWITGSSSSSIPGIKDVANTNISNKPALVPTGWLLDENKVSWYGELQLGITKYGINQNALSGCKPLFANFGWNVAINTCKEYATNQNFKFDANVELDIINSIISNDDFFCIPRLKIAILRLLLSGSKEDQYDTILEKLKIWCEKLPKQSPLTDEWEKYAHLIDTECKGETKKYVSDFKRGQLVSVPRAYSDNTYGIINEVGKDTCSVIIRLDGSEKTCDSWKIETLSEDTLNNLKDDIKFLPKSQINFLRKRLQTYREDLESIIPLFETIKPISYIQEEQDLIDNPFPVIWASTTIEPEHFKDGCYGEYVFKGIAKLGDDIQIVFTPEEYIDRLKKALDGLNVEVLDMDILDYTTGVEYVENMKYCYY